MFTPSRVCERKMRISTRKDIYYSKTTENCWLLFWYPYTMSHNIKQSIKIHQPFPIANSCGSTEVARNPHHDIIFMLAFTFGHWTLISVFILVNRKHICTKISNSTLKQAIFLNTKHINEVRWYIQGINLNILLSKQMWVGSRRLKQMYFILNGGGLCIPKLTHKSLFKSYTSYIHTPLHGTTGKIYRKINASYCTEQFYLSTAQNNFI